jgi:N-acetylmuramic acid 6-phosphate etherase
MEEFDRCPDFKEFLKISSQFRLGDLETEKPHPKTVGLSEQAATDLPRAISILKEVDLDALAVVLVKQEDILRLKADIAQTLNNGKRIFLAGCGATGRLSLVLEVLWRKEQEGTIREDSVVSFMAGGDTALIRSIEDFEDHPGFAHRQLIALGFGEGDLLIASTEGGETPWVIGAAERAAQLSSAHPYFLYCNPDKLLMNLTDRTTRILTNPDVHRINLSAGQMALTGSTRMQASTVLMYAIGLALLNVFSELSVEDEVNTLLGFLKETDYNFLAEHIVTESGHYLAGDYMLYSTCGDLGICVLTDTTERSPTFSLHPFENIQDTGAPVSLVYLCLPEAPDAVSAWHKLLGRPPRPLDWNEYPVTSAGYLKGFDFSVQALERRSRAVAPQQLIVFDISRSGKSIKMALGDKVSYLQTGKLSLLHEHLLLKMILNIHSTLVMGRLGRYESNLMTWVRASNNKLIDRAARYVLLLLEKDGISCSYDHVICRLFEIIGQCLQGTGVNSDRPIVLETYRSLAGAGKY